LQAVDHIEIPMSTTPAAPRFTEKQGQYLAFIHTYALLNGCAPAETDMQRFFRVTPPSVHNMVVELERKGLIRRTPRQARSIELVVAEVDLPPLRAQPIKTTAPRY
jgi:DNA-binding MarR family transcriptional regulator